MAQNSLKCKINIFFFSYWFCCPNLWHLSPISLSSVSKSTRILGPRIKTYPPDRLLLAHEVVLNSPKVHSQKQKDSATNFFNVWRQMSCRFFSSGHCKSESVKTNKLSLFQLRSLWKWKCEDKWVVAFSAPVVVKVKVWRKMSCRFFSSGHCESESVKTNELQAAEKLI